MVFPYSVGLMKVVLTIVMCLVAETLSATIYDTKTIRLWQSQENTFPLCYSGMYFDSSANYCYTCPTDETPDTSSLDGGGNSYDCICNMGYVTSYADCSSVRSDSFYLLPLITILGYIRYMRFKDLH